MNEELEMLSSDNLIDDYHKARIKLILYTSGRIVLRGEKRGTDWFGSRKTQTFTKTFNLCSLSHVDSVLKKKGYVFEIFENREKRDTIRLVLRAQKRKIRGDWIRAVSDVIRAFRKENNSPLVINLQRVLGVPNDGKDDPADCFVTMRLSNSEREIRWPCVKDSKNPVWQLPMEIHPIEPEKNTKLIIKLFDRNLMRSHDLLGVTETKLSTLEKEGDVLLPFKLEKIALEAKKRAGEEDMICAIVLRRVDTSTSPNRKLVFLIRHGESNWNKAERKGVMSVMHEIQSVDHPLSDLGMK